MPTQAERRAATRSAIVDAASERFGREGYAATSVDDILADAGVSKGALYHHFASKEDLFAVVFVATSTTAIRRAGDNVGDGAAPLDALINGCLGWLEVVADPVIGRILLVDGPSALGWDRARTLEEATSLGVVRRGLARAVEAGDLNLHSIDVAARLINACLAEAALSTVVGSPGAGEDADAVAATVRQMIEGLRP